MSFGFPWSKTFIEKHGCYEKEARSARMVEFIIKQDITVSIFKIKTVCHNGQRAHKGTQQI